MLKYTFLLPFILVGCASAPQYDPATEAAAYGAMQACYENSNRQVGTLTDQKDILLYKAIEELGKAANKGHDPCKIITGHDLEKVAMEENTKRAGFYTEFGKSLLSSAATVILGYKLIDTLPDIIGQGGDAYTFSSEGDMNISDSFKSADLSNLNGDFSFGNWLTNPQTSEEVVFAPE